MDHKNDPPNLRLAAESQPHELEKSRALSELGWETREMAANLLRIIRGAGKPELLPQQIINLSEAILEISERVRGWAVWSAMEDTLQSSVPDWCDAPESVAYETTIVRGSLQLVASRLVFQRAQQSAGGREIDDGIRELEERRERARKRWAEEAAKARVSARPSKKRPQKRRSTAASSKPKHPPSQNPPDTNQSQPSTTAEFMRRRRTELEGDN